MRVRNETDLRQGGRHQRSSLRAASAYIAPGSSSVRRVAVLPSVERGSLSGPVAAFSRANADRANTLPVFLVAIGLGLLLLLYLLLLPQIRGPLLLIRQPQPLVGHFQQNGALICRRSSVRASDSLAQALDN